MNEFLRIIACLMSFDCCLQSLPIESNSNIIQNYGNKRQIQRNRTNSLRCNWEK